MSNKKPKAAWDDEPTPLCEKERWQPVSAVEEVLTL